MVEVRSLKFSPVAGCASVPAGAGRRCRPPPACTAQGPIANWDAAAQLIAGIGNNTYAGRHDRRTEGGLDGLFQNCRCGLEPPQAPLCRPHHRLARQVSAEDSAHRCGVLPLQRTRRHQPASLLPRRPRVRPDRPRTRRLHSIQDRRLRPRILARPPPRLAIRRRHGLLQNRGHAARPGRRRPQRSPARAAVPVSPRRQYDCRCDPRRHHSRRHPDPIRR